MHDDGMKIRGFYRLRLRNPDGSLVGESPWHENQITNLGVAQYLAGALGALSGSKQVSHIAVGTGGAPASNATSLGGETDKRKAVTAASSGSTAVRFTVTLGSSDSFVTATRNLSNIGLLNSSATGTLFAGNTYASSSVATNQQVEATYDITFTRP